MKKIFTALCLLLSFNAFCQTTYFVNANAFGANNGSSWTDAFTKLQDALTAAVSGDQVWVAAGTYYPDEGGGLTNDNRSHSFQLKTGVALYGGFAGTETMLNERNVTVNVTTLSGEIQQDNDISNNALHVVQSSSFDSTAVLDGFTVTGGNANGGLEDNSGGGMYNNFSSPTLANCSFSGNTAVNGGGMGNINSSSPTLTNCSFSGNTTFNDGGGMYNDNSSSPALTNCGFSGNMAERDGGAVYHSSSSPTIIKCNFSANTANFFGGGIFNNSSSPTLTDCSFLENVAVNGGGIYNYNSSPALTNCGFSVNTASEGGGGVFNYNSSSPTMLNCRFSGNTAVNGGGGMDNTGNEESPSPRLINCSFLGNMAEFSGGGIVNYNSTPTATNCIFSGNTAEIGGGIYNGDASVTLVNCSFSTNTAQNGGGIYNVTFFDSSSTALINCILWGNTGQIVNIEGSSTVVTYSIVQGGYAGTGNLDKDPLFVDAANGNLHLQSSSPAINAGLNSVNTTFVDLDGNNPRVVDDTIDMGAFEFQQQAMAVSSFTLVNADNDEDIRELKDGDSLNLAVLPSLNLNIRANTNPATVGSVAFNLSGQERLNHIENIAPYALFANKKADYFDWTPLNGNYTLTATPYRNQKGNGEKGSPLTVHFYVLFPQVKSFTLVNAETDKDITILRSGDVINLSTLRSTKLNIRANTSPSVVGSVVFDLSGQQTRHNTENATPYALFGNNKTDYFAWTPAKGNYLLTATPYEGRMGSGKKGVTDTVVFLVVSSSSPVRLASAANTAQKPISNAAEKGKASISAMPNPFASRTTISFSVPRSGYTTLGVYDMKGVEVARLYQASAEGGKVYRANFESKHLPSGVYIVRLATGQHVESYKLVLMR